MTSYELAQYSWDDTEILSIVTKDDILIGTFPLSFVQYGGVNSWRYVLDVIHELVGSDIRGGIKDRGGMAVALEAEPQAGKYVFESNGEMSDVRRSEILALIAKQDPSTRILFARGPEYFRKNVAPNPDGSSSTRSDSKRSTVNQVCRLLSQPEHSGAR
jgi:hypothetical protein